LLSGRDPSKNFVDKISKFFGCRQIRHQQSAMAASLSQDCFQLENLDRTGAPAIPRSVEEKKAAGKYFVETGNKADFRRINGIQTRSAVTKHGDSTPMGSVLCSREKEKVRRSVKSATGGSDTMMFSYLFETGSKAAAICTVLIEIRLGLEQIPVWW
jgi:hypothetical protein